MALISADILCLHYNTRELVRRTSAGNHALALWVYGFDKLGIPTVLITIGVLLVIFIIIGTCMFSLTERAVKDIRTG